MQKDIEHLRRDLVLILTIADIEVGDSIYVIESTAPEILLNVKLLIQSKDEAGRARVWDGRKIVYFLSPNIRVSREMGAQIE